MEVEQKPNKPHIAPHKRDKKNVDIHNIKAFGYSKGDRARQAVAHQLNIEQIRLFQPETKQLTIEDPPLLVAVQGPPGCGKSLLIRCLVKRYTDQNIVEVNGPITVVANRSQRITFVEVPNDINAMTDVAKVADIVLLLVNAEHNFEMETFEFLNILMSHGFPKVIGVLTHLDVCEKSVANQLKARFRKELDTQVKVYKLEKLIHGKYEKKSIIGLGRLLNQNKVRVINFRKGRGYVLCDRAEPGRDGSTLLYGYMRGDGMSSTGQNVHIPGMDGDFVIDSISVLEDPCPLATKETSQRTLKNQERRLYAPLSQVGGLRMDDDAIYVDLPRNKMNFTKAENEDLDITTEEREQLKGEITVTEGVQKVRDLQDVVEPVKESKRVELFPGMWVEEEDAAEEPHTEAPVQEVANDEDDNDEDAAQDAAKYDDEDEDEDEEMDEDEDGAMDEDDAPRQIGDIKPGSYVRMEFKNIPPEFLSPDMFDPNRPVIVGGLIDEEIGDQMTQNWVKIKRHRFYARKPKSLDPLVVTVGWRRYQVLPVFYNEEQGGKLRFMKYMPDFLTCWATFYGPPPKINVGVTAFQHMKENLETFRITATGVTVAEMGDGHVVKKLRVCGHPKEIHNKTVKIDDMFTSQEEATQFEGALIRTVSGIRGEIKKVERNGVIRCSFEDTLKESDIVFLNTWVTVPVREFWTPINSLLSKKWECDLVRTTAEMRSELNLRPEYKEDSVYKDVARPTYNEQILTVPKGLKPQLPYKIQKQFEKKETKKAHIMNDEEAQIFNMFNKISQVHKSKEEEKAKKKAQEAAAMKKAKEAEEAEKMKKRTQRKQEFFRRNPTWVHKK